MRSQAVFLICFLSFLMAGTLFGQDQVVCGYLSDARTGEPLRSAKVVEPYEKVAVFSNEYGFFSLTLPADSVWIQAVAPGYYPLENSFFLAKDTVLKLALEPMLPRDTLPVTVKVNPVTLQEVSQMSAVEVPVLQITRRASLLGEPDVMKTLQLLPGVQPGRELSDDLLVRGGSTDQTLVLLDGEPLYVGSHLYGLFSALQPGTLHQVNFLKGAFAARYGGRLSGVLDVRTREGNLKDPHGYGMIGPLTLQAGIEGPLVPNQTSFTFNARRSWIDPLGGILTELTTPGGYGGSFFFSDLHAKVNHTFSDKDRIFFSYYNTKDRLSSISNNTYEEGDSAVGQVAVQERYEFEQRTQNIILSLRWNHRFHSRLFANFTASYNHYRFRLLSDENFSVTWRGERHSEWVKSDYENSIQDYTLRADFDYYANERHTLKMGGNAAVHRYQTGQNELLFDIPGLQKDTVLGDPALIGGELNLYLEDEMKVNERLQVNMGLRLTAFVLRNKIFPSLQPRLNARYLLDENWALKASYSAMQQPLHKLNHPALALPTDRWLPATDQVKPEFSHQVAAGIARSFTEPGLELSVEGYFKHMNNLVAWQPGAAFYDLSKSWEDRVVSGKGRSYGMEVMLHKPRGRFNGWINYTLAWADRKFEGLSNGEAFPFQWDRRHSFNLATNYQLSRRVSVSGNYTVGSGYATTLAAARYSAGQISLEDLSGGYLPVSHYGTLGAYRAPAYHRLDLALNFRKQKRFYYRTWNISVYNVYNNQNPFWVFLDSGFFDSRFGFNQLSLFQILPSITYKVEF